MSKREEGFEAAAVLDDERIEAGIVGGKSGWLILGEGGSREEAEAEDEKKGERADHGLGAWGRFPTKIEHRKDACDHQEGATPFEEPARIVENLEGGAV